jgi:hypothetical protein
MADDGKDDQKEDNNREHHNGLYTPCPPSSDTNISYLPECETLILIALKLPSLSIHAGRRSEPKASPSEYPIRIQGLQCIALVSISKAVDSRPWILSSFLTNHSETNLSSLVNA